MGIQNSIQAFNRPNTVSTSLWTRSSSSTTLSTTDTYDCRDLTRQCRKGNKGPTITTKQTRITLTNGNTTSRNTETTTKIMARLLHREIPMAWGTTIDSFDSRNQSLPNMQ